MTDLFELADSRAARDVGMKLAADHAEDLQPCWGDEAYRWLRRYAERHRDRFISEQCTAWVAEQGFVTTVPKAWGRVFQRAAKDGVIVRVGWGTSQRRHLSPTILWESAT